MLEGLAGGDAVECAVAERHARHVADDDGNAGVPAHVQCGVERVVDADHAIAALLHAHGELSQADRAVEDARAARQALHLAHDHPQPMLMARPEHLGLRAPGVSGGRGHGAGGYTVSSRKSPRDRSRWADGSLYRHGLLTGSPNAVRLSNEPHGLRDAHPVRSDLVNDGLELAVDAARDRVAGHAGEAAVPLEVREASLRLNGEGGHGAAVDDLRLRLSRCRGWREAGNRRRR